MIDVDEAISLVLENCLVNAPVRLDLGQAQGTVLAEDVCSDIDSPPHDKSLVDGYAVIAADMVDPPRHLHVVEEVTAGEVPRYAVSNGTATGIMTGAPIPSGADAVVMVEQTQLVQAAGAETQVCIDQADVQPGQNIMRRATSLAHGERVLRTGHELRAIETGLLAEIGRTEVLAIRQPAVAVLATGNELVPAGQPVAQGQIRNSNGPMLCGLVREVGAFAIDLGIAPDEMGELTERIERGLTHDVLVLSGGVSAGVLDLVPQVLCQLGVRQVFHKVNVKPGRPLWFGTLDDEGHPRLVFGLPGNPVSSLVSFQLFVRPALRTLAGKPPWERPPLPLALSAAHTQRGNRPTYWPGVIRWDPDGSTVEPLDWKGSADLRSLSRANGLCYFAAGQSSYAVGERIDVYPL